MSQPASPEPRRLARVDVRHGAANENYTPGPHVFYHLIQDAGQERAATLKFLSTEEMHTVSSLLDYDLELAMRYACIGTWDEDTPLYEDVLLRMAWDLSYLQRLAWLRSVESDHEAVRAARLGEERQAIARVRLRNRERYGPLPPESARLTDEEEERLTRVTLPHDLLPPPSPDAP